MPEGGLQALQATVLADLAWAQGLPTDIRLVENETFRRLVSFLVSGMYVLAPQGRIEAFTTLTLLTTQQQLLLPGGCALSNTFKTYEKYGYQPITLPPELHPALAVYVELRRCIGTVSATLFVDYDGKPYSSTKLGGFVTQYFRSSMDLLRVVADPPRGAQDCDPRFQQRSRKLGTNGAPGILHRLRYRESCDGALVLPA
jgi:hypothetical protein